MLRWWMLALAVVAGAAWAGDSGVTSTEIRIGTSAVLSGPLGPQTQEYGDGARVYFDAVNAAGGVHGRQIVYTALDDGFEVKRAVENSRRLISEGRAFLLFNNTGTAQTAAILPLLQETQTVLFGPVTGASDFRNRFNRLVFHVRASYANEAHRIVSQLRQTGITRVAVFYQDDPFGKALLTELRNASEAQKLPFLGEVKIDPKQPDFAAAAAETARLQPQAVLMGTAGATFPNYVRAVLATEAKPSFYGFSVASLDAITQDLKDKARGIVLAQIMPSVRNSAVPVVAEYLKLLRERSSEAMPSPSQLEGFVHAKLLVEGLRRAGRNLSTESFIQAMQSSGEIGFGRFVAKYAPGSHNGSSYVELAIIDAQGQLRY